MPDEPELIVKSIKWFQNGGLAGFIRPPELRVYGDRVELIVTDRLFRKNSRSMRLDQVAQVALRQGPLFSQIVIESTGGHTFALKHLAAGGASRVKAELDRLTSRPRDLATVRGGN